MIHTSITQSCTVFLWRRELSRSAILRSQNFNSTKWLTGFAGGLTTTIECRKGLIVLLEEDILTYLFELSFPQSYCL